MSTVSDLIAELCPDGVDFVTVGDAASLYGGLTGKTKKDFGHGGAAFVPYTNVFSNPAVDLATTAPVDVSPGERQRPIQRGDVLFTGSSENLAEVAMSSVVTDEPQADTYLNSFCFGLRWHEPLLDPLFAKHLFRSADVRQQLVRTASGVTRFNVSKALFKKCRIPVPPLALQREIASILEKMERLEAELEAELEARTRQYEHYREALFRLAGGASVTWRPMGEVGSFVRGRRFTKSDYVPNGIPAIHYGEIYTDYGTTARSARSQVRSELARSLRFAAPGDVIFAGVGETVEDVGKAVAWLGEVDVAIHDDCFAFQHQMEPRFVAHFTQTREFHAALSRHVARAKVKRISAAGLASVPMPVVSRERQETIADILDRFEALISDISVGLPAEIAARRKQYAYYRDLLLTFPEKKAA